MKFKVEERFIHPTASHLRGKIVNIRETDLDFLYDGDKKYYAYSKGEFELFIKEAKMSIKDKIENINEDTTIKELDDLMGEINSEAKVLFHRDENRIMVGEYNKNPIDGSWLFENNFCYTDQCDKLQALKDALLWLAKKSGKLKDNKKEIEALHNRLEQLQIDANEMRERIKELEE